MRVLSRINHKNVQLLVLALCLLAGGAEGQKKKKDDATIAPTAENGIAGIDSSCGSSVAGGCTVMVGLQMVPVAGDVTPSVSAFGRMSFEFDPAFSEMKYSVEILDNNNDPIETSDVVGVYLVCGLAGEELTTAEITTTSLVAKLQFSSQGTFRGDQYLSATDLNAVQPISCGIVGSIPMPNIAAVYESMREGLISVVAATKSQFNTGRTDYIRGQIFLPQIGYYTN